MIQERHRELMKEQFREGHAAIANILLETHQFFESHPGEIQREWRNFIENTIDPKIEDALKKAVKQSLQVRDLT